MKTSRIGITAIAKTELSPVDARDIIGKKTKYFRLFENAGDVPTSGFGSTYTLDKNGIPQALEHRLSLKQAYILLKQELARHEKRVNDLCARHHIHLKQNQFDVLVSRAFNTGDSHIEPVLIAYKKHGLHSAALADAMRLPNTCGGQVKDNLVFRRQIEHAYFISGHLADLKPNDISHTASWQTARTILAMGGGKNYGKRQKTSPATGRLAVSVVAASTPNYSKAENIQLWFGNAGLRGARRLGLLKDADIPPELMPSKGTNSFARQKLSGLKQD